MSDTFQNLILALQKYWSEQGCVLMQPYDLEMGAGTFHPATFLQYSGRLAVVIRSFPLFLCLCLYDCFSVGACV